MEDVAKQAVIVFNKNVNNTAVFVFFCCVISFVRLCLFTILAQIEIKAHFMQKS